MDIVDLGGTDDLGEIHVKTVKMETGFINRSLPLKHYHTDASKQQKSRRQDSEDNRSSSALSTGQSGTTVLDQEQSPVDDSNLCSSSPICAAPVCRQFWKAGNYNDVLTPKSSYKNGSSYLHIHPKFLHSNATSHKWAFGAIAELLDNAVDEVQKGATFVIVDKATNPRNGSPALLIQDDGGGMDPDAMRRCLSFGFSDKKSNLAIGQYGNGFKTSSMRLGADVIVFSRHMVNRKLTQSIGLLSYTFLTQTGHDRIVVPMVDYVFNTSTNSFDPLQEENYSTNLSVLLQWSPYSTEEELLLQFDDVGAHGTKVIVYDLWFIDEGSMELDFESDPEDIRITGEGKSNFKDSSKMAVSEKHIANRLRYSLRAYLSVLYLKLPETFCILLRGRVVEYHNIATDLKYTEFILYKPQIGGCVEHQVVTTIGFLKEAPNVNVHGFNVYHKNRLILPFWPVVSYSASRGRGVVGILEANFIEPTHSKQDFEKTSVFQKLEGRLKEMTWEYWDYHCGLIGYQITKKAQAPPPSDGSSTFTHKHGTLQPVGLRRGSSAVSRTKAAPAVGVFNTEAARSSTTPRVRLGESMASFHINPQEGVQLKRKERDQCKELEVVKRKSSLGTSVIDMDIDPDLEIQPFITKELEDREAINVIEENKRLREQCMDYEKTEKDLEVMVDQLRTELVEAQGMYTRMLAELQLLENVKEETDVQRT